MPEPPKLSGRAAVKAFARDSWRVARQMGSHIILVKEGSFATLSVPDHREIAPGTLRSLIRASGLNSRPVYQVGGKDRPARRLSRSIGESSAVRSAVHERVSFAVKGGNTPLRSGELPGCKDR